MGSLKRGRRSPGNSVGLKSVGSDCAGGAGAARRPGTRVRPNELAVFPIQAMSAKTTGEQGRPDSTLTPPESDLR